MTPEPICGLCRKALRYGQNHELLRVAPEDLAAEVLARLRVNTTPRPGLYAACPDCVAVLKPVVQQRLSAHFGVPADQLDGHNLL